MTSVPPAAPPATVTLARSPALAPLLARGALLSPVKRPRPDAAFPRTRLVLPSLRVDPARLAAYERVCGFPPAGASGTSGGGVLPLTYPHVLGFPAAMRLMSGRGFPLPLLGLVHTSLEITRHRAVPAAGTHGLSVHVEGLAPHRRGTEATVVTVLRSPGGDPVWESRSTYLARHRTPAPSSGAGAGPSAPRPEEEPATARPLPVVDAWLLAEDTGRRYGAASGDRNPIHLHPLAARLFGFPRAVAHGMWTVARCLAAHGVPEAVAVRADFRAPVLLPGTVTFGARDGRFELRGPGDRLHLTGEVRPV
ncbi:MaoC/PaaZ C-terminal domain-containing protein [Streptomyces prasinopilosus]|uniref:Acyl dehydratase n=1 Tax=Streptomyces prasinopilosus TaxID=67344 RepID=A0A1G6PEH3_9ACTN|nr:MaoC/PaaZ C-terminal domain-containing protein [Streptomyces prasinopilosus]SDC78469.1 Acyl dehydratase [Streptomyces prasinopilosus]